MLKIDFLDIPALASASGVVALPGSKSISNRVLLLAAFCSGTTTIHNLLDSDDTQVMLDALRILGCHVRQETECVHVTGLSGRLKVQKAQLFLGNAGTAMRPLTAALSLLGGDFELSGTARMHERPIGDLVDALRPLGCNIEYLEQAGFPPLRIGSPRLQFKTPIQVRGDVSSQFLTSLLLTLPLCAQQDIVIEVVGKLISQPYIEITLNLLQRFGISIQHEGWQKFTIPAGCRLQSPGVVHVEADASSASYFIALGTIAAQQKNAEGIKVLGLGTDSIQGDIRFIEVAQAMGARIESGANWLRITSDGLPLKAIDMDCNHIPDAAMTLAVMALYAQGTSTLRNIGSWRVKETDRIAAMATELRKLGASVVEGTDFIQITPPPEASSWRSASIHTYDDHRLAMCFSLAAFNPANLPVRIQDPGCVAKTFPDYFETLFSVVQAKHIPVICVDGPTASGKGTLASVLARKLGYRFLDSGSLYRITALAARRAGLALEIAHEKQIAELLNKQLIRFKENHVWLDSEDVSEIIRSEEVGMHASRISAFPMVRNALIDLQRNFRQLPGLVADGRDMGTVIFPDADLKVYLTANALCRAERRYRQLAARGISATLASLSADLLARDARDASRSVAPLKPAQNAKLLDNSDLTVDESVNAVLQWWQSTQPFGEA